MQITEILSPGRTLCCAPGASKKKILQYLSEFLAEQNPLIDQEVLFQQLMAREKLGSTGIGDGVAIPHCRLPGFDRSSGVLLKLSEPVDFEAIDGNPVDLIFALVVPEEQHEDHLNTLANIAGLLQDENQRQRLREATDSQQLYQVAVGNQ